MADGEVQRIRGCAADADIRRGQLLALLRLQCECSTFREAHGVLARCDVEDMFAAARVLECNGHRLRRLYRLFEASLDELER